MRFILIQRNKVIANMYNSFRIEVQSMLIIYRINM